MRVLAALPLLALSLFSAPAFAQRDPAAAEALFTQGRAAADAGDYVTACAKFYESNRLDPAAGTVLNMADCEDKQGHIATAWTLYKEVVDKLPASDPRAPIAADRIRAIEPKLPRLSVRFEGALPAGAEVRRDGTPMGSASLDTPLPVDPGKHTVTVTAPGHADRTYDVRLAESEQRVLSVELGAAIASGKDPGGGEASTSSGSPTLGWVLGGVGVVGIGVGAVTGMMVLGKKSTVDDNCDADKRCNQTGADAADSGRTLGTISGVSFAVGAVALAVGGYLILSHDGHGEMKTALVPSAGARSGGLNLVGRF